MDPTMEFSVSEVAWGCLAWERDDQNWPVLAVCELDRDRTYEQLLQPDSQAAFAGTDRPPGLTYACWL